MDHRLRQLERELVSQPNYVNTLNYIHAAIRSGYEWNALHLGTASIVLPNGSLLIRTRGKSTHDHRGRTTYNYIHTVVTPDWQVYRVSPHISSLLSGRDAFRALYPAYTQGDIATNPQECIYCHEPISGHEYGDEWWDYHYYLALPSGDDEGGPLHGNIEVLLPGDVDILNMPIITGCLKNYLEEYAKRELSPEQTNDQIDNYIQLVLEAFCNQFNNYAELMTPRQLATLLESWYYVQEPPSQLSPQQITMMYLDHHEEQMANLIRHLSLDMAKYIHIPTAFIRTGVATCEAGVELPNKYLHLVEGPAVFSVRREINYDYVTLTNQEREVTIPFGGLSEPPNYAWLASRREAEIEAEYHPPFSPHWAGGDSVIRLGFPFDVAVREMIAGIEIIDPPAERIQEALAFIRRSAQSALVQLVNQDYEPEEYSSSDLIVSGVEIERDHESEHHPGPILCRPCFQITAISPGWEFYSNTEELSKDLEAWGVARWEYWAIEVANNINLSQTKYWFLA